MGVGKGLADQRETHIPLQSPAGWEAGGVLWWGCGAGRLVAVEVGEVVLVEEVSLVSELGGGNRN